MKDPVVIQSVVDAGIECGYRLIGWLGGEPVVPTTGSS